MKNANVTEKELEISPIAQKIEEKVPAYMIPVMQSTYVFHTKLVCYWSDKLGYLPHCTPT